MSDISSERVFTYECSKRIHLRHTNNTINNDKCVKRVSISNEPPLVYIVDNTDRRGVWEHYALDRIRFQRRVQTFEVLFKSKVLVRTIHIQASWQIWGRHVTTIISSLNMHIELLWYATLNWDIESYTVLRQKCCVCYRSTHKENAIMVQAM